MLDIIVIETNRKIEETMTQLQSILAADSSSRYGYIRLTNPSELLALIGLIYMRGLLGQVHQGTTKYLAIQFLVQVCPGTDLNFLLLTYRLMTIHRVLLVGNIIDLQLFAKFLKNLTKTVGNF